MASPRRSHRAGRTLAIASGAAVFLGCGGADERTSYAARDSAGVRIVESRLPQWTEGRGWQVDSVPSLSIGVVSGSPELSLSGISGVHRLADGSLAVADGATREVRIFDSEGSFVRRLGRQGSGPGEFEQIQTMGLTGDTVWIYDLRARRLTFIDARTGGFRAAGLALVGSPPGLVGRRADGAFVFAMDVLFDPVADGIPQGLHRPDAVYVAVDPTGAILDTLLMGKGQERIIQVSGDRIELIRPLFNRTASRAVRGDELIYGDQERFEASVYGPDGRLRTIMRLPDADLALTEAGYRETQERLIASAPEDVRPGLRQIYDEQTRPATRPAHARFLIGPDGELWAQDFAQDGSATTWSVLDADGVWLGPVQLPPQFRPSQIGRDELLGVWRDELDVEHVRAYPLRGRSQP